MLPYSAVAMGSLSVSVGGAISTSKYNCSHTSSSPAHHRPCTRSYQRAWQGARFAGRLCAATLERATAYHAARRASFASWPFPSRSVSPRRSGSGGRARQRTRRIGPPRSSTTTSPSRPKPRGTRSCNPTERRWRPSPPAPAPRTVAASCGCRPPSGAPSAVA